ncbi:Ppx/GppA phosphatase family protein [Sandaracinus amylolyticus]|uniref:Ppx/GppA phosphatase family protein n=1 Tax=Sandaracinus amylolyticus TaxID=927083 RepID=UPI001F34B07D|nr:Ppx/GppA phosphatase family protein [Sandaracinus amylolyticus]UJR83924.1 Hypothetical protein I5071_59950 [Sandaracinus amylolyticus]
MNDVLPARTSPSSERETLAALDLGSNSFHLVIARVDAEGVHVLDERREMVRLAEGLEAHGTLRRPVERRALACLERFGASLRPLPRGAVRVVGTNALRKARNARDFVRRAEALLGHPIEIVSGAEEARLTYLGVASGDAPRPGERRLLIDIGGGSTECILGVGTDVRSAHSLFMGCVSFTERFFPHGRIKRKHFESARNAALAELATFAEGWRGRFDQAWGSSGTMRAIDAILTTNKWGGAGITPEGVALFADAILEHRDVGELRIEGLAPERAPVIPGGLAIVSAALEALSIPRLRAARSAMREGILYDLIGRHADHDVREASIRSFAERHGVDRDQAERVQATALALLRDVSVPWRLDLRDYGAPLRWAAMLHEIGQSLTYAGYHKHGAYLVRNATLAGLAREDAIRVSALIGLHRRRPKLEYVAGLERGEQRELLRVAALLRLGAALHRSRAAIRPPVRAFASGKQLELRLPRAWADSHALAMGEVHAEREHLRRMGVKLRLVVR